MFAMVSVHLDNVCVCVCVCVCAHKCMCFVSVRIVSRCAVITLSFMAPGWCCFLPSAPSTGEPLLWCFTFDTIPYQSQRILLWRNVRSIKSDPTKKRAAMWWRYRRCLREASWDKEIIVPYGHLEALIYPFPCGLVFWNFVFVEHNAASRLLLFVGFLWGFFLIQTLFNMDYACRLQWDYWGWVP